MNNQQFFLSNLLRRTGLFTEAQLEILLNADLTEENGIVGAVTRLEMAKEAEFLEKFAPLLGLQYVDLSRTMPTNEALQLLPARAVYQYNALPLALTDGTLSIALSDPMNHVAADGIRLVSGCPVKVCLAPSEDIDKAIKRHYGVGAEALDAMINDGRYEVLDDGANISKIDVNEGGQEASIVRFVNSIIAEADKQGATDIHVEPMEDELRIRYRIDGNILHRTSCWPILEKKLLKRATVNTV